jgi:WD40 repeat protein
VFSHDNRYLILNDGGQVQFWDVQTRSLQQTLGDKEGSPLVWGALAPNGEFLAVASKDRTIQLWDLRTRTITGVLLGHQDQITALAFSPDGKTLGSASWDRTVKLWNVAVAQEVASLEAHQGRVNCLAFSPDGTVLATGGESGPGRGEVYLWRTSDHRQGPR